MKIGTHRILIGDVLAGLATLGDGTVQTCVTSPPYWGLRDYGCEGQIGLEPTPAAYLSRMVAVFREVRRVLRDDATCWINLGDSYAGHNEPGWRPGNEQKNGGASNKNGVGVVAGMKAKDLCGMPWALAFALRDDGWYLRSDIIWAKPNPMPESVRDRPTKSHEYLFLLAKSDRYYFDQEAVKEAADPSTQRDSPVKANDAGTPGDRRVNYERERHTVTHRNIRTVWTIPTQPFPDAHFATYPEALVEPCVKAGSKPGDLVLDPFTGSGTTGAVACRLGRNFVGTELNPEYAAMAEDRIGRACRPNTHRSERGEPSPLFNGAPHA